MSKILKIAESIGTVHTHTHTHTHTHVIYGNNKTLLNKVLLIIYRIIKIGVLCL